MRATLLLLSGMLLRADTLEIRGKTEPIAILPASGSSRGTVLFLPGDGGWHGIAVTMAQRIASWGYNVYGFDTKHYLESFPELTPGQMTQDINTVISWARAHDGAPVTVFGWSQGAGMGILAAAAGSPNLTGIVTLGLPKTAVLSWNWKDMFAAAAHLQVPEPFFEVEPLLQETAVPVWMIYGTADEYTSMATTNRLYDAANEPKRLVKVPGANHRFDAHTAQLNQALQEGLTWVRAARSR